MAATAAKTLPYGTTLPLAASGGAEVEMGNMLVIGAEVSAGTGTCYLYRWWPEVGKFRKYSDNGMLIADAQITGRYAKDQNTTEQYFLLTPNGVTLGNALIFGAVY